MEGTKLSSSRDHLLRIPQATATAAMENPDIRSFTCLISKYLLRNDYMLDSVSRYWKYSCHNCPLELYILRRESDNKFKKYMSDDDKCYREKMFYPQCKKVKFHELETLGCNLI